MNDPAVPRLSEERRKEAFRALVEAQDGDMDVAQSRELVARRYDLTEKEVRQIEREGLNEQWSPL